MESYISARVQIVISLCSDADIYTVAKKWKHCIPICYMKKRSDTAKSRLGDHFFARGRYIKQQRWQKV